MKQHAWWIVILVAAGAVASAQPLGGTTELTLTDDLARRMVDGASRFLDRQLAAAPAGRSAFWHRDTRDGQAYNASIQINRKALRAMLSLADKRAGFESPALEATVDRPALVGRGEHFEIRAIRWPTLQAIDGEGLLITPTDRKLIADVIVLPGVDHTPEQAAGLDDGLAPAMQAARLLAGSGCRVVVPALIDRDATRYGQITRREFAWRAAFELGHHLIGYELDKALAIVDWFDADGEDRPIAVVGCGDGGMLALYAAAIDTRFSAAVVSAYFGSTEAMWSGPIDRNVFGLLREFGDAELASMIWPRRLIIDTAAAPEQERRGGKGAPYRIVTPAIGHIRDEAARAGGFVHDAGWPVVIHPGAEQGMTQACAALIKPWSDAGLVDDPVQRVGPGVNTAARAERQFQQIVRHTQTALDRCKLTRRQFLKPLYDAAKTGDMDKYNAEAETFRKVFYDEVIGRFDIEPEPLNPRTRKIDETDQWVRYEVVLDVFDDVIAYGMLTLPKGLAPGERRPVVVCQHGLEGRPQNTIGQVGFKSYKAFATTLAERGFITFAPQNPYIFGDDFRMLQRKAQPLGRSLFSLIVPQHQQIVRWLKTLPQVDGERIAFYGLSYGGKTAMRVPAIVTDYCLSICSGDFNDWVWKCASTGPDALDPPYTYMVHGEYEIFEWNLGQTFNYAEMAALICPRPFMVERGHFDGVAPDERVAYEYAKVRRLYQGLLGIGDRTRIEFFPGPHTIHGVGTFEFLHEQLNWPRRQASTAN